MENSEILKVKNLYSIRPSVLKFALAMEQNLRKHDTDYGIEGWKDCNSDFLFTRLLKEVTELHQSLYAADDHSPRHEAVDVANFAMMIFDNFTKIQNEYFDCNTVELYSEILKK
jgi:hypothetical protein